MPANLRDIRKFPDLIRYLEAELEWPVEAGSFDDITFEYIPAELGLKDEDAVAIKKIHQLRPLASGQPWGIFFVEFEKKKLPVVVLRRILSHLVIKKRASANKSDRAAWNPHDLLFISAFGDEAADAREIAFAHFHQDAGDLPTLRVLGWDGADTPLKLDHVAGELREKLHWPANPKDQAAWRTQWSRAFRHPLGHTIRTADDLAEVLAALARGIRDRCTVLMRAESERGPLTKLFKAFQAALIHDLTEESFADTYAQTITYGLLTAAINRTDLSGGTEATVVFADDLTSMVRVTSPFLKEMLETFLKVGGRKGEIDFDELGIQDVVELLRGNETDLPAILRDFGNKNANEDPVIRFYEDFLKAYDAELRVKRGVFYTPQPVVSYIVRSVHELLQTEFGLEDGLASTVTWGEMIESCRRRGNESQTSLGKDKLETPHVVTYKELTLPRTSDDPNDPRTISPDEPFVQILDPATGTATFLVEVIDVIFKHLEAKWKKGGLAAMPRLSTINSQPSTFLAYWNLYVPQHLLPRLHGYELLAAPYAIAHLKLGLKLTETGYRFGSAERARIYLTNALEPKVNQLPQIGFEPLAHEARAVNEIKWYKRFTVVIGNPPYAGHSSNTGEWISNLVNDYYSIAGEPLRERNSKWLQDDYVKFIRLAQNSISVSGVGLLGFITNHSFLDNPTFRGMRYSLLESFSDMRFQDLHGNSKKREETPDGKADENVFDIQQGVAITLAKLAVHRGLGSVQHAHLYGERSKKYLELSQSAGSKTKWQDVSCAEPFYLFFPQDVSTRDEYDKGFRIPDAMPVNVLGFQSHRDNFAVAFDSDEIHKRISAFRSATRTNKDLAEQFEIPDNRDWQIASARSQARSDKKWEEKIICCAYRPFDFRSCYFSTVAMDYPRRELLDHVAWRENLCLNTTRQTKATEWRNAVVTDRPAPAVFVELKDGSNVFPLWLYPETEGLSFSKERRPNFSSDFLKTLAAALKLPQKGSHGLPGGVTPEDIFHYAYAVFHSPGYRRRYAEFLKIDFPRLPLTGKLELFRALARLGGDLTALHLLEFSQKETKETKTSFPSLASVPDFVGRNPVVEKVSWTPAAPERGVHAASPSAGTKRMESSEASPHSTSKRPEGRAPLGTVWLDKAQTTGFAGVREDVWNFHIGGYQVCEKWLKDRKGRTLSAADREHYQKIVVALSETIRLMAEIDAVIEKHGGWPLK